MQPVGGRDVRLSGGDRFTIDTAPLSMTGAVVQADRAGFFQHAMKLDGARVLPLLLLPW